MAIVDVLLAALAVVLLVPICTLFVEVAAASLLCKDAPAELPGARPRVALLIPAHNEALVIGAMLESVMPQLGPADEALVVADNCDDNTAAVAREQGVAVVERRDAQKRGKGFALAHGVRFLAANPPEVVIVFDADCAVAAGAVAALARQAAHQQRPVQANYLLRPPLNPQPQDQVAAFAFLVKNQVRPSGLKCLGLPCLLTGNGMAFPWTQLANAPLANDKPAQDAQLAVDLALAGAAPAFCAQAQVSGRFPAQARLQSSQRKRWEHGHLGRMVEQGPRLLAASVRQRRFDLLALLLELCVPPLSLLVILWVVVAALTAGAAVVLNSFAPAAVAGAGGALLLAAIFAAWLRFGRREMPLRALLAIPGYVVRKIPVYMAFLVRRQRTWFGAEREA